MSYLVLARKYRPRDFAALVGQPHVVQALANALTQQRLHHAYLFTGTRGVGKTTVSRILAKSLNCTGADGQGGITAHPCGVCEACREIDAGRFVDYVELDAASNRGVDEISQLLDQAVYKPVLGRFKVYMIDEVHMLSNHAFNAMLKTLEEPPEYLKFVLATTDPQKVPPTVLSRCLQFNLRPLAPQTIEEHLAGVLATESIAAERPALQLLARAARGSMRDALSLTDQAIAHGAGTVDEAGVRQMLGAVDRGHAARLVEALAARDGKAVVGIVDGLRQLGLSAGGTLEEMAALLQQMAVRQAVPDAGDVDDPDAAETARLAALLASDETQLLYSIVLHGREEIGLAPDEYGGLVMVLLRLLAFPPTGTTQPRAVAPAGAGAPRETAGAVAASSAPASAVASAPAPASATAAARPAVAKADEAERRVAPGNAERRSESGNAERRSASGDAERRADDRRPAPRAGVEPFDPRPEPPPEDDGPSPSPPRRAVAPSTPVPLLVSASAPPSPEPAPATVSMPVVALMPATPITPSAYADRWADTVRALVAAGRIGALVRELAMQAECVAIDAAGAAWRLRVERETLRAPTQVEKLQAALAEHLGRAVRLETESGAVADTPALRDAAERARRQAEAEETIQNDPLVRALMAQYKTARIVPGSVKSI
jgi:DNA polymerase-3 subunit gamma/tau